MQTANWEIDRLITYVNSLHNTHIDVELLSESLRELQSLIGMESTKRSIAKTLKFTLMNGGENEGHMHHTVFNAGPGTGKTTAARILAKCYAAMNFLSDGKKQKRKVKEDLNICGRQITMSLVDLAAARCHLDRVSARTKRDRMVREDCFECFDSARARLSFAKQVLDNLTTSKDNSIRELLKALGQPEKEKDVSPVEPGSNFVFAQRSHFVAKYLGQTEAKTTKLLEQCRGKILFIDEAYTLMTDEKDSFGMQAITVLNQFMSDHPNELIVIFAGYKELLDETIFKFQPGLRRRITWTHTIPDYKPEEMKDIFLKMVSDDEWTTSEDVSRTLINTFRTEAKYFKHFGGDCKTLLHQCKLEKGVNWFEEHMNGGNTLDRQIDLKTFTEALKVYKENTGLKGEDVSVNMMYV